MTHMMKLTREAFEAVTTENCVKVCDQVDKIFDVYFQTEPILDSALEQLEFTVNTGSSYEEENDKNDDDKDPVTDSDSDLEVAPLN